MLATANPGWYIESAEKGPDVTVLRALELAAERMGRDLATDLAHRLATLDADLAAADPRQPPAGFRPVVRGRSSWDERITRLSRNRP